MTTADSQLLHALAIGEALDVPKAYEEHRELVWASLYRMGGRVQDLGDLLQEVFLVVHRRQHDYDGRPIKPWLWGICLGVIRNYRRSRRRRPETLLGEPPERHAPSTPETELAARNTHERLWQALKDLDPEKRAVFWMYEVDGMSGAEIASHMGVPVGTVYSRLHHARHALRKALGGSR